MSFDMLASMLGRQAQLDIQGLNDTPGHLFQGDIMQAFDDFDQTTQTELEAAAFRRLLKHLDDNKDVQNIDLMILADFCRNCLSKWMVSAAEERGETLELEAAREHVYGMPYSEWKAHHQAKATPEQLAALDARQAQKGLKE